LAKQELEEAAHYYDSESLVSDLSFFEKSSNASNPSSIIRKERRFSSLNVIPFARRAPSF